MSAHDLALVMDGLVFAEAPRWHDGRLWISDIFHQRVVVAAADGTLERVIVFDGTTLPVGLGFLDTGELLVVDMDGTRVLRVTHDGEVVVHADLTGLAVGILNDMAVDADGRAYVGMSGERDAAGEVVPGTGGVIAVEPDGSARIAAEGVHGPNGPGFTVDGRTYLVSELPGQRLLAFDRRADGSLVNRRVWADLAPFRADGIAVDVAGGVWTASPADGQFRRVLEGGEVTDVVTVPGRRAVACCLGGPEGRTLYLLSNATSEPAWQWVEHRFGPTATSFDLAQLAERWVGNSRVESLDIEVPAW